MGAGFGFVGISFIVVAYVRARNVDRALERGDYARLDDRLSSGLTVAGAALGLATILLVLLGH